MRFIITVAPEIEGVRALIEHFRKQIVFSIGHTAADYSDAVAALEWGASHFTHLFNAMTGMHHREPGVVGAALVSAAATAELIADGIHVHPAVLRVATLAMPNRIALVTDAVRAAGMPRGKYKLYDHEFTVTESGGARLGNGTLAGSTLTMQRAVQNMVELAGRGTRSSSFCRWPPKFLREFWGSAIARAGSLPATTPIWSSLLRNSTCRACLFAGEN